MGLILDTNVFIKVEKSEAKFDFEKWASLGDCYISAITVSELLVGVHLANTPERRAKRIAFVESIINGLPAIPFTSEVARVHAELFALLSQKGRLIGTHDLMIAASAVAHGFAVMTGNISEFERVPGLDVIGI
jgi:predicted nucleic acid-binding protein